MSIKIRELTKEDKQELERIRQSGEYIDLTAIYGQLALESLGMKKPSPIFPELSSDRKK